MDENDEPTIHKVSLKNVMITCKKGRSIVKVIFWLLSNIFIILFLFFAAAYFIPRTSSDLLLVLGTILFLPVIIAILKLQK